MPIRALDDFLLKLDVPIPEHGILDELDPALPDSEFSPEFCQACENVRFLSGKIETRKGRSSFASLVGTGDVRLLDNVYTSDSKRFRIAARGSGAAAIFYDFEQGVDSAFQTTTGGSSLGGTSEPYFQGVVLNDIFYFTDRAGALRKYQHDPSSGNQVRSVALPSQPASAPGVKAKTYDFLDPWNKNSAAAPFGWTVTDNTAFDIKDASGIPISSPLGGVTVWLDTLSSPKDKPIYLNTARAIASAQIAMWVYATNIPNKINFKYGANFANEFNESISPPTKNDWYPFFVNIGSIPSLFYTQFNVYENSGAADTYLSGIALPGRLQGAYRYVYTHYDSSTGRESKPSAISNSGVPIDFSVAGTPWQISTAAAFQKACAVTVTSDSGSDSSTNQMRIYRNGGLAELTKDDRGIDIWARVGTIGDVSTTLTGAHSASATSSSTLTVASTTGMATGDWLVVAPGVTGTNGEEYVYVSSVTDGTHVVVTRGPLDTRGLANAHTNGQTVQIAFVDNVPNSAVDITTRIYLERDDPRTACKWVVLSPDGRLILGNFTNKPTGVAFSNMPSPDRPTDYEVFPSGVDPTTRRNPLQGWDFEIGGDVTDEEIIWLGFFNDILYAFTKRNLYAINCRSQLDWSSSAIVKALKMGCLNGDTVQIIDGYLYWVAPGPTVMRWNGIGAPETIGHRRVSARLAAAPTTYWNTWFARYYGDRLGHYYTLFVTPSGQTQPTDKLDYNTSTDTWEPVAYYKGDAVTKMAWQGAVYLDGRGDTMQFYAADADGGVWQLETGSTDNSGPIQISFTSKRFWLNGSVSLLKKLYLRMAAVSDSINITLTTGGSEYGNVSVGFSAVSLAGSNDLEIRKFLDRTLNGRWCQIQITGSVSNRPSIRQLEIDFQPFRVSRLVT